MAVQDCPLAYLGCTLKDKVCTFVGGAGLNVREQAQSVSLPHGCSRYSGPLAYLGCTLKDKLCEFVG